MGNPKTSALVSRLLRWYDAHARDLPWRRSSDPYAILVSEVMLQQTQVVTVIPYFERWMREFPTMRALADAPEEKVLKLWEGLGYYSRARNLHRAARLVQVTHHGVFPSRFDEVLELPGVGLYTAGAVCSIAFNQPTPILDGNVARVLARLFKLPGDPRKERAARKFRAHAQALVSSAHQMARKKPLLAEHKRVCSSLNQSLMELGALVCTSAKPLCPQCPVASLCAAFRSGEVAKFPRRVSRRPAVFRRQAVFVVRHRGRILLAQRPAGGVNAGFFELPTAEIGDEVATASAAAASLGLHWSGRSKSVPLCRVRHGIMHFRFEIEAHEAKTDSVPASKERSRKTEGGTISSSDAPPGFKWKSLRELKELPLTSVTRKVLKSLTP